MCPDSEKDGLIMDADVCVVGGACVGPVSALCAAENGAETVVLLKKMKRLGGTLGMCTGFFGVESLAQEKLGITPTACASPISSRCCTGTVTLGFFVSGFAAAVSQCAGWSQRVSASTPWFRSRGWRSSVAAPTTRVWPEGDRPG